VQGAVAGWKAATVVLHRIAPNTAGYLGRDSAQLLGASISRTHSSLALHPSCGELSLAGAR